jgi:hypothetical protein
MKGASGRPFSFPDLADIVGMAIALVLSNQQALATPADEPTVHATDDPVAATAAH